MPLRHLTFSTMSLQSQSEAKVKVLVVDDDEAVAMTLRDLLELEGYAVTLAATAPEALREAQRHRPDVILLDINLPGINGLQLARLLREAMPRHAPRMAALSGLPPENLDIAARGAGLEAFFRKPVDVTALLTFIARAHAH
jgi:CheY-like chemotaxis protein